MAKKINFNPISGKFDYTEDLTAYALVGQTMYIGTTGVAINRASALLNLAGIPLIIGGSATTADLTLQTTSGVGAAGADMHFLVGNNGATEAMTILNNGNVGIGTTSPTQGIELSNKRMLITSNAQDNEGERLILQNLLAGDATDSAKATIAFKNVEGNSVAWLTAHKYSSAASGGALHQHFSIETSNVAGDLYTRMAFPYATDISEVQFNLSNLTLTRNTGETNGNLNIQGSLAVGQGSHYGILDVNDILGTGVLFRRYGAGLVNEFRRANGTIASPTAATNGNTLGQITFSGRDSAGYRNGASIKAEVDGVSGDSDMPGRLLFLTTPDGSATLTERMRITQNGNVGIGTTSPNRILGIGGLVARNIGMEKNTVANTAGFALTVNAGGATAAATDKAGGDLILNPGVSTGSAESGVQIKGCVAGASGTTDRTLTTAIQVLGNRVGFFSATPVVRQAYTAVSATPTQAEVTAIRDALVNLGLMASA